MLTGICIASRAMPGRSNTRFVLTERSGELMKTAEFHFDFGSANAYLSHLVLPRIEGRTGVTFEYVPVLLGGIFKLTNNRSPMESFAGVRNKLEYQHLEIERFVQRHGITNF